jgi:hypothetical protein
LTVEPSGGPVDWVSVDAWFFREKGIVPHLVGEMTMAEIAVCMEEVGPKPPGGKHMTTAEIHAYAARMRSLTPLDKLRLAKEGNL